MQVLTRLPKKALLLSLIIFVFALVLSVQTFKTNNKGSTKVITRKTAPKPRLVLAALPNGLGNSKDMKYVTLNISTLELSETSQEDNYVPDPTKPKSPVALKNTELLALMGLDKKDYLFQYTTFRNQTDGYLLYTNVNDVRAFWDFDPTAKIATKLFDTKMTSCMGEIISWDPAGSKIAIAKKVQSLTDSSSDNISGFCIYDYKNQKVVFDFKVPVPEIGAFYNGFTTKDMSKMVLEKKDSTLVISVADNKRESFPNEHVLEGSQKSISEINTLVTYSMPGNACDLFIQKLDTGIKRKLHHEKCFFKTDGSIWMTLVTAPLFDGKSKFFLEQAYLDPFNRCWFDLGLNDYSTLESADAEKLVCADEIHPKFFNSDFDRFRAVLHSYVE